MDDLVIIGCGGHGREVLDTVLAVNRAEPRWNVVGFLDDRPDHLDRLDRLGQRVLGPVTWLEEHDVTYVLGIGSSAVRSQLAARLDSLGRRAATIVHPEAIVGAEVTMGAGCVVFARSTVTTNVRIGRHTHLNVGCSVQHDTTLGDFVQLSPGVFVNGDCTLEDHVFAGTGAIVTRGCRVGAAARIGAGAVVLSDLPAGVTAIGAPARPA